MISLAVLFFFTAAAFSALGLGGGAVYVPLLIAHKVPFHLAVASSQAVIVAVSISALLLYHRAGYVDWKLVLLIEPATDLGALLGGYFSHHVPDDVGKIIFATVVSAGAVLMLRPMPERSAPSREGFAYWVRSVGDEVYTVNWVVTLPLMVLAGLLSGFLGIGGGMLKVPLLILACRVPVKLAVGSSTVMIGITSLTGLIGHAAAGYFDATLFLPLAAAGLVGAQIGARFSVRTDRRHLKLGFGVMLLLVALWVSWGVLHPA